MNKLGKDLKRGDITRVHGLILKVGFPPHENPDDQKFWGNKPFYQSIHTDDCRYGSCFGILSPTNLFEVIEDPNKIKEILERIKTQMKRYIKDQKSELKRVERIELEISKG